MSGRVPLTLKRTDRLIERERQPVCRAAGTELTPGALAFGPLLVATVALGAIVAMRRPALPRGRDLGLVIVAGVLWFGLYNLALNSAEQLSRTNPGVLARPSTT